MVADSIKEMKPAVGELEAEAGDYWSDELRVTYRLAVKDGKLWPRSADIGKWSNLK